MLEGVRVRCHIGLGIDRLFFQFDPSPDKRNESWKTDIKAALSRRKIVTKFMNEQEADKAAA
jgi:hypothetical protein